MKTACSLARAFSGAIVKPINATKEGGKPPPFRFASHRSPIGNLFISNDYLNRLILCQAETDELKGLARCAREPFVMREKGTFHACPALIK